MLYHLKGTMEFLGYAINHTNRDGGGHILEWEKSKMKEEKH